MSFEAFFYDWLIRHENFSHQLANAAAGTQESSGIDEGQQHQCLVDQVLAHYQEYYVEKSRAASEDVFRFISPPWFTSFERTFLWIGGFRPSWIFRLITDCVQDLTAEQDRAIQQVKAQTKRVERELGDTMATAQESLASSTLMNLSRQGGTPLVDEELSEAEAAMTELRSGMLSVLQAADMLRGATVREVVQILRPIQSVKLLAAAAQFHLRIRRLGLARDQDRCLHVIPN